MTLRVRLFATYVLIVVISLAVVAIATTALLQGYRDRLAMEKLDNIARPISVQIRSLTTVTNKAENIWSSLEEQAEKNDIYILLIGNSGKIIRQITPTASAEPITISDTEMPTKISEAVQGKLTVSDGRIFIYAAYPLTRLSAISAVLPDAIVIATPRTGSLAVIAGLFIPFTIGGIIALITSLVIAIIFARSIYKPLNSVKDAAHKIAQGDYEQRVPEEGPREVRELAAGFNHMTEQVKQSQIQLRHFVADVSHELKSPLTAIQGFSQALVDGTANDEQTRAKAASIINSESKRMKRQVDELLDLSRMQSGQFKMTRETVNISELLKHCHDIFDVQAKEKDIQLRIALENPLLVSGDSDRLEQLFCNLLDNAIKNTPNGGKEQTIARKTTDGFVEVKVIDEGPGIHPEHLPFVFERFYQVTGVRTGVGLGLAIAREIVRAHGGTVEARSEPGQGAEFIVRLPAVNPS
ncbi:MAG TPA: HAMP domain-containing sensor histidine kinase [Dehalococcoidales bacterium]